MVSSAGWTVNPFAVPVTFRVSSSSGLSSPVTDYLEALADPLDAPSGMITVAVALE